MEVLKWANPEVHSWKVIGVWECLCAFVCVWVVVAHMQMNACVHVYISIQMLVSEQTNQWLSAHPHTHTASLQHTGNTVLNVHYRYTLSVHYCTHCKNAFYSFCILLKREYLCYNYPDSLFNFMSYTLNSYICSSSKNRVYIFYFIFIYV